MKKLSQSWKQQKPGCVGGKHGNTDVHSGTKTAVDHTNCLVARNPGTKIQQRDRFMASRRRFLGRIPVGHLASTSEVTKQNDKETDLGSSGPDLHFRSSHLRSLGKENKKKVHEPDANSTPRTGQASNDASFNSTFGADFDAEFFSAVDKIEQDFIDERKSTGVSLHKHNQANGIVTENEILNRKSSQVASCLHELDQNEKPSGTNARNNNEKGEKNKEQEPEKGVPSFTLEESMDVSFSLHSPMHMSTPIEHKVTAKRDPITKFSASLGHNQLRSIGEKLDTAPGAKVKDLFESPGDGTSAHHNKVLCVDSQSIDEDHSKLNLQIGSCPTSLPQIPKSAPKQGTEPTYKQQNKAKCDSSDNQRGDGVALTTVSTETNEGGKRQSSPHKVQEPDDDSQGFEVASLPVQSSVSPQGLPQERLSLSSWGLPESVLRCYHDNGITTMFEWQAECLCSGSVLAGGNLVYSAPTSAGKTMVAELLMLKRVLETGKKAIMILPFVSVAREKMHYLQRLFQDAGVRVEGYMGSLSPAGGFAALDVAVCTIEKANSLVNRLMEEGSLDQLSILVVDELHMIGDSHRGYLLELLLTKIRYMSSKSTNQKQESDSLDASKTNGVQIVGMSATLPNLDLLASWLDADLYHTDFRPVPLTESVKIGTCIYDSNMKKIREIDTKMAVTGDTEHVIPLCLETILNGHSVLVFCPTKNWCEKLAETIAKEFYRLNKGPPPPKHGSGFQRASDLIKVDLNRPALRDVVEQLRRSPVGLDSVLGRVVPHGVAYHHAGLTFDERDIVEGAFRQGLLRVLVATSTLSSGVNLPARRVIIRTPMFHGAVIDTLTYKQMVGRAGRKGIDTEGESVVVCKSTERSQITALMRSQLRPVQSCLIRSQQEGLSASMKRAILEVVVSQVACTPQEVAAYARCTLLATSLAQQQDRPSEDAIQPDRSSEDAIQQCMQFLQDSEIITLRTSTQADGRPVERYLPTQLGSAVLASALSPNEGLVVFVELQKARRCFVLENELHIIYQVTPIYQQDSWPGLDWYQYLCLWEHLPPGMKQVAELVGVQESFLARAARGRIPCRTERDARLLNIHKRFYTAMVLHDLVHEIPLGEVARKYSATKGMLQSLQQSAATFAGMVTIFCSRLGWVNLELLLGQFQSRLTFGVQRELVDLVRLSLLNGQRARVLFNSGLQTVAAVAATNPVDIEQLLRNAGPFQSIKKREGESDWEAQERRKSRCIWLTGQKALTEMEAAVMIVEEAKQLLQQDLGQMGVDWKPTANQQQNKKQANETLNAIGPKLKSPPMRRQSIHRLKSPPGARRVSPKDAKGESNLPQKKSPNAGGSKNALSTGHALPHSVSILSPPPSMRTCLTGSKRSPLASEDTSKASVPKPRAVQQGERSQQSGSQTADTTDKMDKGNEEYITTERPSHRQDSRQMKEDVPQALKKGSKRKCHSPAVGGRNQKSPKQSSEASILADNIDEAMVKSKVDQGHVSQETKNGAENPASGLDRHNSPVKEATSTKQVKKSDNQTGSKLVKSKSASCTEKGKTVGGKTVFITENNLWRGNIESDKNLYEPEVHEPVDIQVKISKKERRPNEPKVEEKQLKADIQASHQVDIDNLSSVNVGSGQTRKRLDQEETGCNGEPQPNTMVVQALVHQPQNTQNVQTYSTEILSAEQRRKQEEGKLMLEGQNVNLPSVECSKRSAQVGSPDLYTENSNATETEHDEFSESLHLDTQTVNMMGKWSPVDKKGQNSVHHPPPGGAHGGSSGNSSAGKEIKSNTEKPDKNAVAKKQCDGQSKNRLQIGDMPIHERADGKKKTCTNRPNTPVMYSEDMEISFDSETCNYMARYSTQNYDIAQTASPILPSRDQAIILEADSPVTRSPARFTCIKERTHPAMDRFPSSLTNSPDLLPASNYERLAYSEDAMLFDEADQEEIPVPFCKRAVTKTKRDERQGMSVVPNNQVKHVINNLNALICDDNVGQTNKTGVTRGSDACTNLQEDLEIAANMSDSFTLQMTCTEGTAADTKQIGADDVNDSLTFSMLQKVLDSEVAEDTGKTEKCDVTEMTGRQHNKTQCTKSKDAQPSTSVDRESHFSPETTAILSVISGEDTKVKGRAPPQRKRTQKTPSHRRSGENAEAVARGNGQKAKQKRRSKERVETQDAKQAKEEDPNMAILNISHDTDTSQNETGGSECVPPTPPENTSKVNTPTRFSLRTPRTASLPNKSGTTGSTPSRLAAIVGAESIQSAGSPKQRNSPTTSKNGTGSECSKGTPTNRGKPAKNSGASAQTSIVGYLETDNIRETDRSMISSSPSIPCTDGSFAIIDVTGDKRLFDRFITEWETKSCYSVCVACERLKMDTRKGPGIGSNFRRARWGVNKAPPVADGFHVDGTDLRVVGVSVCWENRDAYYVALTKSTIPCNLDDSLAPPPVDDSLEVMDRLSAVKAVLEMTHTPQGTPVSKLTFDLKEQYKVLAEGCGVVLEGQLQDPKVAYWLLDPGAKEQTLHRMVTNYIPIEAHLLEGIGGGGGLESLGLSPQAPGSGRVRAAVESVLVCHLVDYFKTELDKLGALKAFMEVEMPSHIILAKLELNGFGFSDVECESQKTIMQAKLTAIEEEAYLLAGHPFSLTSTEDIAQVLFLELKLPPSGDPNAPMAIRPRKGAATRGHSRQQFSTSKDILEKLKAFHPLPGMILEWRRITSAMSKVVYPLQKEKVYNARLDMHRIHVVCQTHTATGRVSMTEPNLQNIPKDFEINLPGIIGESPSPGHGALMVPAKSTRGHASRSRALQDRPRQTAKYAKDHPAPTFAVSMRHAFVPFEGGVLVAADYSQLELRIIAHLSQDAKLIKILNSGGDVFKTIAAQWKSIDIEDVTAVQRQQAKQVCYGMIYGIGAKALGEQLEVDENDGAMFIETFKSKYTGMRTYLRQTVQKCREQGYVETMLGRRRHLPAIKDTNPHARAHAERQAVNTTVQGSAADLVKLAMVNIDQRLREAFPQTHFSHRHMDRADHARRKSRRIHGSQMPSGGYLVLQLHDELIYEVSEEDVVQVAQIIKMEMERAMTLLVKLPVKVKAGASWGSLQDMPI